MKVIIPTAGVGTRLRPAGAADLDRRAAAG